MTSRSPLDNNFCSMRWIAASTASAETGRLRKASCKLPCSFRGSNSVRLPFFRSEEHTSELQSLMRISYAVFCLKKKKHKQHINKLSTIITYTTCQYNMTTQY